MLKMPSTAASLQPRSAFSTLLDQLVSLTVLGFGVKRRLEGTQTISREAATMLVEYGMVALPASDPVRVCTDT